MALKGQKTTASYLEWNELTQLIRKLQRDKEYKFCLLLSIGCFTGLRISDILKLHWSQILNKDVLELTEKKTKKYRSIKLNKDLQQIIEQCYELMKSPNNEELVFLNRFKTKAINVQWVKLKQIFIDYKIKTDGCSTHSMRKTFGRFIWQVNNHSEKSLLLLSEIFNHSSIITTKRYLGIRIEEIHNVYDQLKM